MLLKKCEEEEGFVSEVESVYDLKKQKQKQKTEEILPLYQLNAGLSLFSPLVSTDFFYHHDCLT